MMPKNAMVAEIFIDQSAFAFNGKTINKMESSSNLSLDVDKGLGKHRMSLDATANERRLT